MFPLFSFLSIINPTWYFNLPSNGNSSYFPDYDKLTFDVRELLILDAGYSSIEVSKLDAAYQAWNKGIILDNQDISMNIGQVKPSISDNYRFVRKYFHPLWSWYVLIFRMLTLNNPLIELSGFIKHRSISRVKIFDKVFSHLNSINSFQSLILQAEPKVSVIIPTLNRYPWLNDALKDLEIQDYKNFEVIVVDQSEPFQADFYSNFNLDIKVIRQEEKALWKARNSAIKSTDAEFILLYDDDSRTEKDWISAHLKCLDYFCTDISSGVSLSVIGAKVPENYAFYRWSDQVDTGNAMVKRDVFRQIGLFDLQFEKQRQGDGEFGLRSYLHGFKNISNPIAKRIHLKAGYGGLRQMGSWDGFRPKNWFSPRPVPSVLYLVRKYFGVKAALYSILIGVPPSLLPYKYKRNNTLMLLSSFFMLPLLPLVGWQVWKSWHLSSIKLKQGPLIEKLNPHSEDI